MAVSGAVARAGLRYSNNRLQERGQMTVELCVVIPVVLIVAVISINALQFFGMCSEFDRVARNSVRVVASSPSHGKTQEQLIADVKEAVLASFDGEGTTVEVTAVQADDCMKYTVTLEYLPTLFGANMRQEIFGVSLPALKHSTQLSLESYTPGMTLG